MHDTQELHGPWHTAYIHKPAEHLARFCHLRLFAGIDLPLGYPGLDTFSCLLPDPRSEDRQEVEHLSRANRGRSWQYSR